MKNLQRSISSYLSSDRLTRQLFKRNYSVPYGFNYNEADDDDLIDGCLPGQTLPPEVLECLMDAYGAFSEIYKAIIKPNENFQPRLSDAVILLPDIAYLTTDNIPNALQTVYDVLTKIKQERPNLQQQNMVTVLKAIQNAMVILHTDERDHLDVDIVLAQPRDMMAAVMIINKYLTNLIHPSNSVHY